METGEQIVAENFEAASQVAPAIRMYPDALVRKYNEEGITVDPDAVRDNLRGGVSILWMLMEDNIAFLVNAFEEDLAASLEHFGERIVAQHSFLDTPDDDQGASVLAHFVVCLAMNIYTTAMFQTYQETGEGEDDEFDIQSGWPVAPDPLAVTAYVEQVLACIPFDAQTLNDVRRYTTRWLGEVRMHLIKPPTKSKYH